MTQMPRSIVHSDRGILSIKDCDSPSPAPMRTPSFLALALATLAIGSSALPAQAYTETFGSQGNAGRDGRSGRSGGSGERRAIRVTDTPQTVNLTGRDGENGEDGNDGSHAYSCDQPEYADHNLRGAAGGRGGNGGNGGMGGRGGTVSLFYQDLTQLSTVQLINPGGRGGRGGRGARGGDGCQPEDSEWVVKICRWELQAKRKDDPNATWKTERHRRQRCRDEYGRNRPRRKRDRRNKTYRWKFDGVVDRDRYYAYAGDVGRDGQDGRDGRRGSYGQVYLISGGRIPQERLTYRAAVADSLKQPIQFTKNNWLKRSGLAQLLAPGSDVPSQYRRLETVRNQLQVKWLSPKSIQQLGNPKISATIDPRGQLDVELPGHLEYRTRQQNDQTLVTIMQGIEPQRLQQIQFRGFEQFRDAQNFALIDTGKVIKELRGLILRVKVSDGEQTIKQIYRSSPRQPRPAGLEILGDIYKISLDEQFTPLLKPGKKLTYNIEIDQITRSGAVYQSRMAVQQVVDKVTFSDVKYFRTPQPTE